ncbi:unnamed protein product [Ilex paraguariensis]|uniref:Cytochrome P450 n=1 Tax=Ilex paraguariensis TaxID=185542 RepID=A0ABC8TBV4_9AQUA
MEFQFPSISILLAFLLFLFALIRIGVKRSTTNKSTPKLPPGPWQLPLIGNMHQLLGSLTHHVLRDLSNKYGPLMHLRLGEVSTVIVSSPEIAKEVMKTHDIIFANRPYLLFSRILSYDSTNIGFSPYGDYWRQLRKICTVELLNSNRVQGFRSIREEEVLHLIRSISPDWRSPINLSKKIFSLTYGITARAAFGKKNTDQEAFVSLVEEVVKLAGGFSLCDMYPSFKFLQLISGMRPRLEKLHKRIDEILENIVNDHKEKNMTTKTGEEAAEEDLVDVLLKFLKHGDLQVPLTDRNIKAVLFDILSAGSDTSSTAVVWAMSEMLKSPQVMKRAQTEFPSISILLAFLLFLFALIRIGVKRSTTNKSTPKLPPGPWQLPLIGNMHQLLGSLTHHVLRDLSNKYGPLMHLRLGEVSTVIVSSPEIAKEVMKTHDIIFANRPYLLFSRILSYDSTNIGFSPYGDYWRQLRKICTVELLNSNRVQGFRSIREEEVLHLIRSISPDWRSPINLSKKIFSLTYGITARAAFGKKNTDQEAFVSLVEEVVKLAGGFSLCDMYPSFKFLQLISGMRPRLEKLHKRIDEILENIVNDHKEKNMTTKTGEEAAEEDLVDVLLKFLKHGDLQVPLTDRNIKAVLFVSCFVCSLVTFSSNTYE